MAIFLTEVSRKHSVLGYKTIAVSEQESIKTSQDMPARRKIRVDTSHTDTISDLHKKSYVCLFYPYKNKYMIVVTVQLHSVFAYNLKTMADTKQCWTQKL